MGFLDGLGGLLTGGGVGGGISPLGLVGNALQQGGGDMLSKLGLGGAADYLFGKHTLDPSQIGYTAGQENGPPPAATGDRSGGLLSTLGPAALRGAAQGGISGLAGGGGPLGGGSGGPQMPTAPNPMANRPDLANFLASLRPPPGRGGRFY